MRLDKYLSDAAAASRSEAAKAARRGEITVNGKTVKSASVHIDPETSEVFLKGRKVVRKEYTYIMLNKPVGYISSTDDKGKTVMELLPPEALKMNMFPCGRLDIDTTGLLLITNNGPLAHELLSPRHHVMKKYAFECISDIGDRERLMLEAGVDIGGHVSLPAKVSLNSPRRGEISVSEGKFHQIKRMFRAVGTEICRLERIEFGPLSLDGSLERGMWRYLSEDEENALVKAGKSDK